MPAPAARPQAGITDPRLAGVDPALIALRDAPVAISSRRSYIDFLLTLQRLTRKTVLAMIIDAPGTIAAIYRQYKGVNARRAAVTSVKACMRHVPAVRERVPQSSVDVWTNTFRELKKQMIERHLSGEKTEAEKLHWVTWKEVIEARERQVPYTRAHLLMCCYSMIPPLRQDFGNVRIFGRPSDVPEGYPGNYLVLSTRLFVLQIYKTRKSMGVYRAEWPQELVNVVRETLRRKPRAYLFEKAPGVPYRDQNDFQDMSYNIFKAIFQKKVSTNMLRHSYISSLDYNSLRPHQQAAIASAMRHSVEMQMMYRKFDSDDEDSGAKKGDK